MDRAEMLAAMAQTGCRLDGPARAGLAPVTCPDAESKIRLLDLSATSDARYDPEVRAAAVEIVRGARSTSAGDVARAIHAAVLGRCRYLGEGIETFQKASETWRSGLGDCDDHARLVLALARSVDLRCELGILRRPNGDPRHAVAKLWDGQAMQWAETTLAARFGEHPIAAKTRLKASERGDIGAGLGFVGDAFSLRPASSHKFGRDTLMLAWSGFTLPGSKPFPPLTGAGLQAAQGVALTEGGYGDGWTRCPSVQNNWGSVQLAGSPHPGCASMAGPQTLTCPPGSAWCTDSSPSKSRPGETDWYEVCFKSFGTPVEGATHFLRTLLAQRPGVAKVIGGGDADAIAQAMYESHYFEGFARINGVVQTPAMRIANYAAGIAAQAEVVAAALGEPVRVTRGSSGLVGSALTGAWALPLAAVAAAGAGWLLYRHGGGLYSKGKKR